MKYNIQGDNLPVVICELDANESMITERGAMAWMSPNMRMETKTSGIGKGMGRMFSGDSFFQNIYTAQGGNGMIGFCKLFSGQDCTVSGRGWTGIHTSETCISGIGSRSKAVRAFPQKDWKRSVWRRRIYYAEGFRKWNRLCGV